MACPTCKSKGHVACNAGWKEKPRKPKSVGVKAWGISYQGDVMPVAFDKHHEACKWDMENGWNGSRVIPVMIVPCKEGKQKGAIRRLASGEGEKT